VPRLAHRLWCVWWSGRSTLLPYAEELVMLSINRELGFWHTISKVCRGWCSVMLGQGDRGISEMTIGLSKLRATLFGPLLLRCCLPPRLARDRGLRMAFHGHRPTIGWTIFPDRPPPYATRGGRYDTGKIQSPLDGLLTPGRLFARARWAPLITSIT
jgi:hypothetical protein